MHTLIDKLLSANLTNACVGPLLQNSRDDNSLKQCHSSYCGMEHCGKIPKRYILLLTNFCWPLFEPLLQNSYYNYPKNKSQTSYWGLEPSVKIFKEIHTFLITLFSPNQVSWHADVYKKKCIRKEINMNNVETKSNKYFF